jgi:hypothetical protein
MALEELASKIKALEETRRLALAEMSGLEAQAAQVSDLERDRDALLKSWSEMMPEDLDALTGVERNKVYRMLRLEVIPTEEGFEVAGALAGSLQNETSSLEEAKGIVSTVKHKAQQMGPADKHSRNGSWKEPGSVAADERGLGGEHRDIAIDKTFTSAGRGLTIREIGEMAQPGQPLFGINTTNGGRIAIFAGGVPLIRDGEVVGAVGVSGAPRMRTTRWRRPASLSLAKVCIQRFFTALWLTGAPARDGLHPILVLTGVGRPRAARSRCRPQKSARSPRQHARGLRALPSSGPG